MQSPGASSVPFTTSTIPEEILRDPQHLVQLIRLEPPLPINFTTAFHTLAVSQDYQSQVLLLWQAPSSQVISRILNLSVGPDHVMQMATGGLPCRTDESHCLPLDD